MASGAFESITIGGRRFTCKADDTPKYKLSGFSNESLVQGDGTVKFKKTRHAGELSGVSLDIDDTRGDFEFLQNLQDGLTTISLTATMVDGTILSGDGQLTEELERDASENVVEITFQGKLEKL